MSRSRIELSYRFSVPVAGTTGQDSVGRYYNLFVEPEELNDLHEDIKTLAVKYGAVKTKKEEGNE